MNDPHTPARVFPGGDPGRRAPIGHGAAPGAPGRTRDRDAALARAVLRRRILRLLRRHDDELSLTVEEIAAVLGVDAPTVGGHISRLSRLGLVRRDPCAGWPGWLPVRRSGR